MKKLYQYLTYDYATFFEQRPNKNRNSTSWKQKNTKNTKNEINTRNFVNAILVKQ